jgi:predicted nuclease of predicted toxin-antitoxin system
MLRLLSDENFSGDLVRGLLLRRGDLDLVRTQDVGLSRASDAAVLAWAADENRIVVTHDRTTMPNFAFQRVVSSQTMPGLLVVNDGLPARQAIDELLLIAMCAEPGDLKDRVLYLPL